jgi:hypothetical protein
MEGMNLKLNQMLTKWRGKPNLYTDEGFDKVVRPYRLDLVDMGVNTADTREAEFTQDQVDWIVACEKAKKYSKPKPIYAPEAVVTPSDDAKQDSMQRGEQKANDKPTKTAKTMIAGVETVRFTLRLAAGNSGRKDVFIEKHFVNALNKIEPDTAAQVAWLIDAVKQSPKQAPAVAIRGAIVTELLTKWR